MVALRVYIWLPILFCACSALAQFEHPIIFDEKDGMSDRIVRKIDQDEDGFIWLATRKGISRFDGSTFLNFDHNPEDSNALFLSSATDFVIRDECIWIGGPEGLSRLDLNTFKITNLPFSRDSIITPDRDRERLLPYVHFLIMKGDSLWIGTREFGLLSFHPGTKTLRSYRLQSGIPREEQFINPGCTDHFLSVIPDISNDSILWMGRICGLVRFNVYDHSYRVYNNLRGDANEIAAANIHRRLFQLENGHILYSTWGAGVNLLNPETGEYSKPKGLELPDSGPMRQTYAGISRRDSSTLWINGGNALVIYDYKKGAVIRMLPRDPVHNLNYKVDFVDESGRIWAGTNSGLVIFDPVIQQFRIESFESMVKSPTGGLVRSLKYHAPGNEILVAAQRSQGLYLYNRTSRKWTLIDVPPEILPDQPDFSGIYIAKHRELPWYVATRNGVIGYDPKTRQVLPFPVKISVKRDNILSLCYDLQGGLWIGTYEEGLFRYDHETGELVRYHEELNKKAGWSLSGFRFLFVDTRGNLHFMLKEGHGTYITSRNRFVFFKFEDDVTRSLVDIKSFSEGPEGKVWVSSSNGQFGYIDADEPEAGIREKRNLFDLAGIDRAYNIGMRCDEEGSLWALTSNHLVHVNPGLGADAFSLDYTQVTDEGLFSFFILPTGELALGMGRAIAIVAPQSLRRNREKPRPYLSQIRILGEPIPGNHSRRPQPVQLKPNQKNISFAFSAVGYTLADQYRFRYRLKGLHDQWEEAGDRRYVNYTNLPSGNHTFQLQVANNEGVWSDEEVELQIEMATPWYRLWWFQVAALILIFGLVWGMYSYRVNRIRKESRLKADFEKKIANVQMTALRSQMNPHFIFNCLNSIENYIIKNEPFKAAEYINDFARLIRLILQNSRSDYITLEDEIEALNLYLQMESLRFKNKFSYHIRLADELDPKDIDIPPMLIQPYVENAIWHGLMPKEQTGQVEIFIERQNGLLKCIVEDNGIGRERSAELNKKNLMRGRKSMGMLITRDRMEIINEIYKTNTNVKIIDLKDEGGKSAGTRVELEIPLEN